jgi:hypothetical protein
LMKDQHWTTRTVPSPTYNITVSIHIETASDIADDT